MRLPRSPRAVGLALVAAVLATAAGTAYAAPVQLPAQPGAGTPVTTCSNPVLGVDAAGYGRLLPAGAAASRTAAEHVTARHAFTSAPAAATTSRIYAPQQPVRAGERWSFALDHTASAAVSARMSVDWYSTATGSTGWLGRVDGPAVPLPGGAGWTRVEGEFLVPAGAVRANVTADITGPASVTWSVTACDYRPLPAAEPPPTTTTVPPTTTVVEPPPTTDPTTAPPTTTAPPVTTAPPTSGPPSAAALRTSGRSFTQDGNRFVWMGDTAWALFTRLTREEVVEYLDVRRAQGFNVVQAAAIFNQAGGPVNRYGHRPTVSGNVSNTSTPYWDHVDFVVTEAARRGITMGILPVWADGQTGSVVTTGNARGYGTWLAGRYRDDTNVTWIMGGDASAAGNEGIWRELAAGLAAGGSTAIETYHPRGDQTSTWWFNTDAWIDYHMIQGGHCLRYDTRRGLLGQAYGNQGGKPYLDGEPIYEAHPYCWEQPPAGRSVAVDVRRDAYWAMLAGAAGHTYGHHVVWPFSTGTHPFSGEAGTPGHWRDALQNEGANDMRWARQLIESRPRLEPDAGTVATPQTGVQHQPGARAVDGATLMAYTPTGRAISINLDRLAGTDAGMWWFNPRTGIATALPARPSTGTVTLTPPTGEDWVLVADDLARAFGPPGVVGPIVTPPTSTTPPPTTTTVPPPAGDTAAARFGWGAPLPVSDEFNYVGAPDPAKWNAPNGTEGGTPGCWPGHAGNGRRCAKNATVNGSTMVMRGETNGDSGWLAQRRDAQYGRWEIRSRSRNVGASGGLYHPLHLIWPTARNGSRGFTEYWPEDGEYDWVEYFDPGAQCVTAFLHYPHNPGPVQQESRERCGVDMTQWHNFAFEWGPSGLVGFVDGVEWFRVSGGATSTRRNIQDMPSGHLNIQLDNFTGDGGLRPAEFEVDWVNSYEYR